MGTAEGEAAAPETSSAANSDAEELHCWSHRPRRGQKGRGGIEKSFNT